MRVHYPMYLYMCDVAGVTNILPTQVHVMYRVRKIKKKLLILHLKSKKSKGNTERKKKTNEKIENSYKGKNRCYYRCSSSASSVQHPSIQCRSLVPLPVLSFRFVVPSFQPCPCFGEICDFCSPHQNISWRDQ